MANLTIPGQSGPVSQDQFEAYWNQAFNADPQLQALIAQAKKSSEVDPWGQSPEAKALGAQLDARMQALGYTAPDEHYGRALNAQGQLEIKHGNFAERHPKLLGTLITGAALGGPLAAAALGGGGGAAGAGAGLGGSKAVSAAGALTGGGGLGANAFKEALKVLGPIAGKFALDKLTTKPLTDATNVANADQMAATNRALEANKAAGKVSGNVYLQQRQDLQNLWGSPYQTLGQMMGLSMPPIGPGTNVVNSSIPGALANGNQPPSGLNPAADGPNPLVTPGNPMGLGPGLQQGTVRPPRTLAELQAMGGR